MSFEDAVQALETAIETDDGPTPLPVETPAAPEQATPSATPEGTPTPVQVQPHHAATQPRDPASGKWIRPDGTLSDTPEPAAPVQDTFDGGQFNPDTLPAELQPAWKQLQAAYTRKTQEFAQERAQFDGLDPATARQAVELFNALQDPTYLVQFHSELSTALEAQGLTRAEAHAAAAQMTEEAANSPSTGVSDALSALREDPELRPVADYFAALETKHSSLEERLNAYEAREAEAQQQEAYRMRQLAMAAEMQRSEMAILAANPNYTTTETVADGEISDMDAIYALASHFDGNLFQAEQFYSAMNQRAVSNYVSQKTAVDNTPGVQTPVVSTEGLSDIPALPQTLDDAQKAAEAYLKGAGLETLDL